MKMKFWAIFKYTVFLGIGIFFMWWQLSKMTPAQKIEFSTSLRNANYLYIIPVFFMAILSHLSRAMRWRILIETMDYKPSVINTFYATLCGYFANNFVPRSGEILRCTLLGRKEKIPFTKLVGTIITERLFDLVCYILVIAITFLIQIKTVSEFIADKINAMPVDAAKMPLWMKVLVFIAIVAVVFFIIRIVFIKYKSHPYIGKIKTLIADFKEGISTILRLKKKKEFLAHTFFIWAMYLLQIYIGFNALTATDGLGMGAAFSVLTLSTLAMIISPGGLGAFPLAVQQVLLAYNVDNISFGWLMWGVSTGIIILAGLISFVLININKHEKN